LRFLGKSGMSDEISDFVIKLKVFSVPLRGAHVFIWHSGATFKENKLDSLYMYCEYNFRNILRPTFRKLCPKVFCLNAPGCFSNS